MLATLLQFDKRDYDMIESGKKKVSLWGTVDPVVIGGGDEAGSTYTSSLLSDTYASSLLSDAMSYLGAAPAAAPAPGASTAPAASSVAEVSISTSVPTSTAGTSRRTTSLQF